MNIIDKIKEPFREGNRPATQMKMFLSGAILLIGTQAYGLFQTPNIRIAHEFDYCGKKAKVIVEERKLAYNSGYVLMDNNPVIGTFVSDDGDTIKVNINGYVINSDSTKW